MRERIIRTISKEHVVFSKKRENCSIELDGCEDSKQLVAEDVNTFTKVTCDIFLNGTLEIANIDDMTI